jgi:hypothetical protein
MDNNIDTRIIHNFLNDDEIIELTKLIVKEDGSNLYQDFEPTDGYHVADTYYFNPYIPTNKRIYDILVTKIIKEFGSNIFVDAGHILHSYHPYGIHSDVISTRSKGTPSWTFIIPLDHFDSNTIVFDQKSADIKTVEEWVETHKIDTLLTPISDELYQKYFTQCTKFFMDYLSINNIFPWEKGALFAASRENFHTSDNYLANGIKCKKAIIVWTSILSE